MQASEHTVQSSVISSPSLKKLAVIYCTKNCERTIANAISCAKDVQFTRLQAITIVVDGFSTDNTIKAAKESGATSVVHQPEKKYPGKGIAMRAGLAEAARLGAEVAMFLDADIKNLTSEWVAKLLEPVLEHGYDMARGYYDRRPRDAAVTKLVAKPMISIFFPELAHIEQPLSGEVCATMKAWNSLLERGRYNGGGLIPDGWGIDVWFLIEAAMVRQKITEVYLGKKEHTSYEEYAEDVGILSKMSEQVLFTILREAINYKRLESYKNVTI